MGEEIEKKYLIMENGEYFGTPAFSEKTGLYQDNLTSIVDNGKRIVQGYIPTDKLPELEQYLGVVVDFKPAEVRIRQKGSNFYFTVKSEGGLNRKEFEIDIDKNKFERLWDYVEKGVEKVRYVINNGNNNIEVDYYLDRSLVVAEIEFDSEEEAEQFPPLGKDITLDKRYKNKNLATILRQ